MKKYVLGMEMGGTSIRTCIGDKDGKIFCVRTENIDFKNGDQGIADQILRMVKACAKEAHLKLDEILGFGIGAAGQPDEEKGVIHNASNCPWKIMRFPGKIQKALKMPLWIRNDIAVAVYAARKLGVGKEYSTLSPRWDAAMTIGTGTNIALVYNGELLLNSKKQSMEWGHCKLNVDGGYLPKCGCGGRGCIESYVGGSGIRTRTIDFYSKKKAGKKLLREPILAETRKRLSKGKKKPGKIKPADLVKHIRAEDVYGAYRKTKGKDPVSKKIVDDTSTYLAYAFGNILSSYPMIPYVEIFGSVAVKNPELTVGAAVNKLMKDPRKFCNRDLDVSRTEFRVTKIDRIGLHGAVEFAWHKLGKR